jgi:hypothetical protein
MIKKNILEEINKSGIPLEIKITEILENDGWITYNQSPYFDEHENKWREIDMRALKWEDIKNPQGLIYRILLNIIIECKTAKIKTDKSGNKIGESPWVFYVRKKEKMHIFEDDFISNLQFVKMVTIPEVEIKSLEKLTKIFHYNQEQEVGTIAVEPFNKKESQFFDARHKVIKSSKYLRTSIEKAKNYYPSLFTFNFFSIIYPVIVVDGKVYKMYNEKEIIPANIIQYLVGDEELFLIDVVKFEFFYEYLKILDYEFENLINKIQELNFKPV